MVIHLFNIQLLKIVGSRHDELRRSYILKSLDGYILIVISLNTVTNTSNNCFAKAVRQNKHSYVAMFDVSVEKVIVFN